MCMAAVAAVVQAQDDVYVNDSLLRVLELDEVEVVSQKPIIKMTTDKITYDITQDADAKAATVLDMLRKVPMVVVDGQDNITVNGSSNFKIYVDGKPNPMFASNPSQILKALPATMVKNIEVITNPGAKYEAEGVGGILNFTLNHGAFGGMGGGAEASVNGINGNVRLGYGNKSYGAGSFLSGQFGKFSFSANANLNHQAMRDTTVDMLQSHTQGAGSEVSIHQDGGRTRVPFEMANLSLGYELDSMSTVNATIGFTSFNTHNKGLTSTTMRGYGTDQAVSYDMMNTMDMGRKGLNLSADYQRFLNAARTSSFTFTYLFARNPGHNENRSVYDLASFSPASMADLFIDFLADRYSDSHDRSTENTLQADYTTPLSENHTLNTGLKYTSHVSRSEAEYFLGKDLVYKEDLSSTYQNSKDIMAGYAEYEGKFGAFSSRAGLRYEHTWQSVEYILGKGSDFKNDYGNLIPSLSLSYSPVMFANVGLTYNLRISRPGISYLNPYVDRSNNTVLTYGNPDLDVEKSHNMGLVMNLFTPKVMTNINLRYAYTGNGIEQYSFYKDGILNTTYGNIVERNIFSGSMFLSYLVHKNTRLFTNLGFTHNNLRSEQLDRNTKGWQYNVMAGVQQTLPWKMNAGVFLIANSKNITLQGSSTGFQMLSANISKSLLKDKMTIALQGVTGISKGGKLVFDTINEGSDFTSRMKISVPLSSFAFTVKYNFGNSKVKVREHKSKVNSDVIEQRSGMEQISTMGQQKN